LLSGITYHGLHNRNIHPTPNPGGSAHVLADFKGPSIIKYHDNTPWRVFYYGSDHARLSDTGLECCVM
jgi:hypothetical protein